MCQEEEEIFRDDDPLLNVCFFLHYLFLSIKIIFILCGNSFFFLLHSRDASQPLVSLDDVKIKKMFFKTFGNEIVRRIATIRKFVKNSPLRTNRWRRPHGMTTALRLQTKKRAMIHGVQTFVDSETNQYRLGAVLVS